MSAPSRADWQLGSLHIGAGHLPPHMADHLVGSRHALQNLRDILAQLAQLAATVRACVFGTARPGRFSHDLSLNPERAVPGPSVPIRMLSGSTPRAISARCSVDLTLSRSLGVSPPWAN